MKICVCVCVCAVAAIVDYSEHVFDDCVQRLYAVSTNNQLHSAADDW